MKKALPFALAVAFAALSSGALAQAQPQDPSNPLREGQSPRCDALSGDARDQCLKDEGAKTDISKQDATSSETSGSSAAPASSESSSSSSGASSSPTDASKPETPSATETPPATNTAK